MASKSWRRMHPDQSSHSAGRDMGSMQTRQLRLSTRAPALLRGSWLRQVSKLHICALILVSASSSLAQSLS